MNSKNCCMPSTRAVKEGIAPGRCGIPAEIQKHTWRCETRHLQDFLRREKFCSKAWFKQEHTTANFPCAQGTFYLTSSSPLRRGITWSLQGAPDPQLPSLGLCLVSDVQWTQCYWVDKRLAQRIPVHPDAEKLPPTDWSILIDNEHDIPNFQVVRRLPPFSLGIKCCQNSSLQCLQNSFTR